MARNQNGNKIPNGNEPKWHFNTTWPRNTPEWPQNTKYLALKYTRMAIQYQIALKYTKMAIPKFFRPKAFLNRVTRLSEFSLFGWLFTLGSFCKNCGSSTNNWAIFSKVKVGHYCFTRNGLGYILGDFFIKRIWSPCS
jgi:hypothetical protein